MSSPCTIQSCKGHITFAGESSLGKIHFSDTLYWLKTSSDTVVLLFKSTSSFALYEIKMNWKAFTITFIEKCEIKSNTVVLSSVLIVCVLRHQTNLKTYFLDKERAHPGNDYLYLRKGYLAEMFSRGNISVHLIPVSGGD